MIAKGVAKLPQVQNALKNGLVIVAGGTTNGYIAEELTDKQINKELYTAGVICEGRGCITPQQKRITPIVLNKGEVCEMTWQQALEDISVEDVFIKGGNALDHQYNVGVMVANPKGGTIGAVLGTVIAKGANLIFPVGLEKMIPSVKEASKVAGIEKN